MIGAIITCPVSLYVAMEHLDAEFWHAALVLGWRALDLPGNGAVRYAPVVLMPGALEPLELNPDLLDEDGNGWGATPEEALSATRGVRTLIHDSEGLHGFTDEQLSIRRP